jgi:hypothetical protein
MKTKRTKYRNKVTFELSSYGSYIDEVRGVENILARRTACLQIELIGSGEMPPDTALLLRSILAKRTRTHVVTHARSSLEGAAVLVWLLGDTRLIREDARLYFRAAGPFAKAPEGMAAWKDRSIFDKDVLEEEDNVRVLQAINEFLPVRELADRTIDLPVLKQFGLVDTEKVDQFLASAFQKAEAPEEGPPSADKKKIVKEASR